MAESESDKPSAPKIPENPKTPEHGGSNLPPRVPEREFWGDLVMPKPKTVAEHNSDVKKEK